MILSAVVATTSHLPEANIFSSNFRSCLFIIRLYKCACYILFFTKGTCLSWSNIFYWYMCLVDIIFLCIPSVFLFEKKLRCCTWTNALHVLCVLTRGRRHFNIWFELWNYYTCKQCSFIPLKTCPFSQLLFFIVLCSSFRSEIR